ncbi:MAG: hypothetical protein E7170_00735 [Firmicutes bacterium]|nr:hypothetical protein [Bacillota bacterium]
MEKFLNSIKKIFIFISAIFLLSLIVFYSYRFIHYYRIENGYVEDEKNFFTDKLEKTINITDTNGGLYVIEDEYIYKYNTEENYLWYSGQLWRILKINEDKTIDIILEDSITLLNSDYENEDYINNYINEFYEKLDKEYLVDIEYCNDIIDNIEQIECKNIKKSKITLLNMYLYNKIGGKSSYLNDQETYWLINKDSSNNNWFVNNDGSLSLKTDNKPFGIKVVVRLKNEINLIEGNGTIDNPYIIKKSNNFNIGEYIKFNNELYRIINLDDKGITISKNECLKENDTCILKEFGFNSEFETSSLYSYLNDTYYNSIENKDFIIKSNFEVKNYTNYNYNDLTIKNIEAYICINKIGDYYIYDKNNTYLLNYNESQSIYSINDNSNYYLTFPNELKNIYPVLKLDINLKIIKGDGTKSNPYELSR